MQIIPICITESKKIANANSMTTTLLSELEDCSEPDVSAWIYYVWDVPKTPIKNKTKMV